MKLRANLKKIATLTALTLCLTGCLKKETASKETKLEDDYATTSQKISSETLSVVTSQNVIESDEEKVSNYIDEAKNKLVDLSESEEWTTFKETSKEYVVTGIDFLFYDGQIKGVTFSELTDTGKEKIMNSFASLIDVIDNYYPGLIEDLSEKYQTASLFINEKYLDTLDSIKEYLGEENYNSLTEIQNQVTEDIGEKTNEAIDFFSKKYQNWKLK